MCRRVWWLWCSFGVNFNEAAAIADLGGSSNYSNGNIGVPCEQYLDMGLPNLNLFFALMIHCCCLTGSGANIRQPVCRYCVAT